MFGLLRFFQISLIFHITVLCLLLYSCKSAGQINHSDGGGEKVILVDTKRVSTSDLNIRICSFNIKFLGLYKKKDHQALAEILKGYDLVLIQELVSPPVSGVFPDGSSYTADVEAKAFLTAMLANGFKYLLSGEDTGTNDKIHSNSSSTEWFIAFYDSTLLTVDKELTNDFLADDRSNHPSYERVPYAFSFETKDNGLDFTIISVHLQPGSGTEDKKRRKEEMDAIVRWIDEHDMVEKDFLIAGDMNIQSQEELFEIMPLGYRSLNEACLPTNLAMSGKPYDHIFYRPEYTGHEIMDSLRVIDLVAVMRPFWKDTIPYPEHDLNLFYQYYSDHKPIVFTMVSDGVDDD